MFLVQHGEMFDRLSPSFMGLACSSHRIKLFIRNKMDNHRTQILYMGLIFLILLFLTSEKLNCWKVEFM